MPKSRYRILVVLFIFVLLGLGLVPGCKSKEEKKKSQVREGTIVSVDPASGTVSMSIYIKKLRKERIITGDIANAEIYIDGKLVTIEQLRPGDYVSVEGYKKSDKIVATRIRVVRTGGKALQIGKKPQTTQTR